MADRFRVGLNEDTQNQLTSRLFRSVLRRTKTPAPPARKHVSTVDAVTQTERTEHVVLDLEVKDAQKIGELCEEASLMMKLEQIPVLTAALRHLVRLGHPWGNKITFPVPEAVDRIHLKSLGLPTNPEDLDPLLGKVFQRRNENFDLDELYTQFVSTHGRIEFDHTQKWPNCNVHTYHP